MKVLIISYYFAPYNTIGAVRVSKLAKYWVQQGYDVRILTAKDVPLLENLALEIPQDHIIRTPSFNIDLIPQLLFGGKAKIAEQGYAMNKNSILNNLKVTYKTIFNFPDSQIGWLPYALRYARKLLQDWKPDFIYASATPFTSLLIAKSLSRTYKIPWLAELRDLWVDNHYDYYPKIRRFIEEKLEKQTLSTSTGIITVSEPLANTLRNKYNLPVRVILNGYDSEDFPQNTREQVFDSQFFNIVYTGTVQAERDPSPLFAALKDMGNDAKQIRIHFYGRINGNHISRKAEKYKVENLVEVHSPVSYKEALYIQMKADILLLLLWNNPLEKGVYTGKLFEYIGAYRPILGIGPSDCVAAALIEQRKAGLILNDPSNIIAALKYWINQKQENGFIPSLPTSTSLGLERKEQFKELDLFISQIIK